MVEFVKDKFGIELHCGIGGGSVGIGLIAPGSAWLIMPIGTECKFEGLTTISDGNWILERVWFEVFQNGAIRHLVFRMNDPIWAERPGSPASGTNSNQ